MKELPEFTGACQCGAVRYTVTSGPGKANVCLCKMCRRATGAPVPSFISVPRKRVTWLGKPTVYVSSLHATRGFCGTCGTPLYCAGNERRTLGLTAGSANIPVSPDVSFYYDQNPEWLVSLKDLPKPDFEIDARSGDADKSP